MIAMRDNERVWIPLSAVAKEYNRHPESIRRWCVSGFLIELGFSIRQDETGHWIVGVPRDQYQKFSTNPTR
jgi:hypothetical protein